MRSFRAHARTFWWFTHRHLKLSVLPTDGCSSVLSRSWILRNAAFLAVYIFIPLSHDTLLRGNVCCVSILFVVQVLKIVTKKRNKPLIIAVRKLRIESLSDRPLNVLGAFINDALLYVWVVVGVVPEDMAHVHSGRLAGKGVLSETICSVLKETRLTNAFKVGV